MRSKRGHTLVEMVVAASLFGIFLTMATHLLGGALHSTHSGEDRGTAQDQVGDVLYRISDELRNATSIDDPSRNVLLMQGSPYLVFTTPAGTVGYSVVDDPNPDPNTGPQVVMQRVLYQPGYVAGVPGTQVVVPGSRRFLSTAPSRLWFSITPMGTPPGHGGTTTGPGTGLALGHAKQMMTIQVEAAVTPQNAPVVAMRTKKTMWESLFPTN